MNIIEHEGVIDSIVDERVMVRITSLSACSACHAKTACGASNSKEKIIDIYTKEKFEEGQRVMVYGTHSQGFKATWIAYVLPVILIVSVLTIIYLLTGNEGLAGIMSLVALIPYFVIIKMINERLKKTFSFKIETLNLK